MSDRKKIFVLFTLLFPVLSNASRVPLDPWNGISDLDQRLETIQSLCASLKYNYAGWELKKKIKLREGYLLQPTESRGEEKIANGPGICEAAIAKEKRIGDPLESDRLAIAKHNLQFSDRILALGASFKDSHLQIERNQNRTQIRLGLTLIEINQRYYVSSVTNYLTPLLASMKQTAPQKGDEIITWNGRSVRSVVSELYSFVGSSSEHALLTDSLSALTKRTFAYPESAIVRLEWKTAGTDTLKSAELHWIFGNKAQNGANALNEDDLLVLRSAHVLEQNAVLEKLPHPAKPDADYYDLRPDEMARMRLDGNIQSLRRVFDESGDLLAQKGIYGNIVWIQIRTFSDWTVGSTRPEAKAMKGNLSDYLAVWLATAAEQKQKVVLDLRFNPGGNLDLARDLAALFLPARQIAIPATEALVVTSSIRQTFLQLFQPDLHMNGKGPAEGDFEQGFSESFVAAFEKEKDQRLFMSPIYREKKIQSKNIVKTKLTVLIWTGPECASACEVAVMTFSKNHLATIMGSPTNGTGMGVSSENHQTTAGKISDVHQTHLSEFVPNFYFGAPVMIADPEGLDTETRIDERVKRISENRPMPVDIPYSEQIIDLNQNGLGWLQTSQKLFSGQLIK